MVEFERATEEYKLVVAFVQHPESVLMGQESTILVRPQLLINGRTCHLSILKNIKATITTHSYVDNIPVTKVFENLQVNHAQEVELGYQVPPNLASLSVILEAEVENISQGRTDKLQGSHSYHLRSHSNDNLFCEAYLRKTLDGYDIYVLGKNGEPKEDTQLSITFMDYMYPDERDPIMLQTDSMGKVRLGALTNVTKLIVKVNLGRQGGFSTEWNLPKVDCTFDYP